ncbi:MAG: AraC family transcriptional regulator N-terminal domain-containing protein [Chloroflexota bacterium]
MDHTPTRHPDEPTGPDDDLAALIRRRAAVPGLRPMAWPGLATARRDEPHGRAPEILEPCAILVAQGAMRVWLGGTAWSGDPGRCLVVTSPVLVETEVTAASPEAPFLALRLRLEPGAIAAQAGDPGGGAGERRAAGRHGGVGAADATGELRGAACRLLRALDDPGRRRELAPAAEREALSHLLAGEQGSRLRAMISPDSRAARIAAVLRFLQANFDRPLDVAALAGMAGMSGPAFHHAFSAETGLPPLQYLKRIRLHRARLLMLRERLEPGAAARRVGYASGSRFSQEYRRLFGASPTRDVSAMQMGATPAVPLLETPPPAAG